MKYVLCLIAILFSSSVWPGIAVIVHPSNASSLDKAEISRIFLGKMKSFPSGGTAIPVNIEEGAASRAEFEKAVLNKTASQIKAYWSKLVFTGKGTPPKELPSDAEIIALIKSNPNLIGYVSDSAVTGDVKVVANF